MKKRIFIIALALVLTLSIFTAMEARQWASAAVPSGRPLLSFFVLGDIHDNIGDLERALNDLSGVNPHADAMILNGDVVNQGLEEQYETIQACLEKNSRLLPEILIKNIGNHEYFNYSSGTNTPAEIKEAQARYLAFSGEQKVYHDIWIKGYHFISLGSEQSNTVELGNTQAFISGEQQKWLAEKLAENYEPGRPIFVFLHQHMRFDATGGIRGWVGIKQNNEVRDILARYPEVILFSSHTHTFLESGNMVYSKQPFTAIHTGPVYGPLKLDEKTGRRIGVKGSQGLYVEISKNKLTVMGRNLLDGSWIRGAVYTRDIR